MPKRRIQVEKSFQLLLTPARMSPEMYWTQQTPNLVRVYTHSATALRFDITSSTTFVDMVSNLGGILGLFAGFSLLSGIEVIYWMAMYIASKVGDGRSLNVKSMTR